ncbi:hypothetical protein PVAG01_10350 [Phlyctema vagabunda]|uniref:Glycoprotease family protein n=1 Tax=Phlyctema vagabunda TaxID=108571 RepID=A0ABR4P5P3_9HELO
MSSNPQRPANLSTAASGPSTNVRTNPFETAFDDQLSDESDDEWWDDKEDSRPATPSKPANGIDLSEWPKPPGSSGARVEPKSRGILSRKVEKRYSVQRPLREKSKGRQKKQNAKAGIKVVTTFTRHVGPAPIVEPQPQKSQALQPQTGCFVDLATLQALGATGPSVPMAFWKSRKNRDAAKPNNAQLVAQPVDREVTQQSISNRRLSTRSNSLTSRLNEDLSPNDRPIVIGISIPTMTAADHTLSPQSGLSEYSNNNKSVPETPAIVITPAQEKSFWSPSTVATNSAVDRTRATSSIFAQSPYNAFGFYNDSSAPPMPAVPSSILDSERQRAEAQKSYFSPDSDDGTMFGRNGSPVALRARSDTAGSGDTIFEEDDSPAVVRRARATSYSAAASKAVKHISVSTVATRRKSRGWWTYITTPFLTRANTIADRSPGANSPPVVPDLALAAEKAQISERDNKAWERQFSPLTPATSTTITSDAWWNTLRRDEPEKDPKIMEQSPVLQETRHKVQESSGTLPFILASSADIGSPSVASAHANSRESTPTLERLNTGIGYNPGAVLPVSTPSTSTHLQSNNPFVRPQHNEISNSSITINNYSNSQSTGRENLGSPPTRSDWVPAPQSAPLPTPGPPPYSPPHSQMPKYRAVFPPGHAMNLDQPSSPGPLSPGLQRAMTAGGGIPMSEVPLTPASERRPININSGYPELPTRSVGTFVGVQHFPPPPTKASKAEARRKRYEKEEAVAHRAGGWWRGRGCVPNTGCYGRGGAEGRKRRRWYLGLIVGFILMIILVIVLATTLHRKPKSAQEQSRWLNLTGFPPIPTGISTIAAPVNVVANTGCTFPSTTWSCDLPKEEHAMVTNNNTNQPNFVLQIQWDNSSLANATFSNVTGTQGLRKRGAVGNPVSAGQYIRRLLLGTRDLVFTPSPSAPSFSEESFLGGTTDEVVASDKAGESTPFYISFLSTRNSTALSNKLTRRDDDNDETNQFPNVTAFIPAPSLDPDGTAAPANLLPYPIQQPIRLYDRGLPTERYSFYNYFDRSIFLKSIAPLDESNLENGEVPADRTGGSTKGEASVRCTWAQTRFLVEIWTRRNGTARLNNATSSTNTIVSSTAATLDFTQPGTFPYPITISLDRHGGDPQAKLLYCYGMNDREEIIAANGTVRAENRGFGGTLINQAPSLFSNDSDPSLGGFDGGTGGCSCQWTNFQKVIPVGSR